MKGKVKSSSTKEFLGKGIDTYKRWIKHQMNPDMNWTNIEIDHVQPICMFDFLKDKELKQAFCRKNTQSLLEQDHQQTGNKVNFLEYQFQFIKAYQFVKLNDQEGPNQDFF